MYPMITNFYRNFQCTIIYYEMDYGLLLNNIKSTTMMRLLNCENVHPALAIHVYTSRHLIYNYFKLCTRFCKI